MPVYTRACLLLICAVLSGCAGFQPRIGMSVSQYKSECRATNWTNAKLVRAEGDVEVYYCDNVYIYSYFKNGRLVRVDQGRLPKQEIELNINKQKE